MLPRDHQAPKECAFAQGPVRPSARFRMIGGWLLPFVSRTSTLECRLPSPFLHLPIPMKLNWMSLALGAFAPIAWSQTTDCSSAIPLQGEEARALFSDTFPTTTFGQGSACDWQGLTRSHESFYQWTAVASGDYLVSLQATDYVPGLALYEGVGCSAVCVASMSGSVPGSTAVGELRGVQAGETFLIHCASLQGVGGSGLLRVTANPCTPASAYDDPFEPNDSCFSATPLGPGAYDDLWVGEANPDWYLFQVPALSGLRVLALPLGNQVELALSEGCSLLPESVDQVLWKNSSLFTQSIWVRVSPESGRACAEYDLAISEFALPCSFPSIGDVVLEPNDSLATAALISAGTYSALWGSAGSPDFYAVDVPSGQGVALDWTASADNFAFDFFAEDGTPLANSGGRPGYPQLGPINRTASVQRVIVSPAFHEGPSRPDCGSYTFTLSFYDEACDPNVEDVLDRPQYGGALEQPIGNGVYEGLTLRSGSDHYVLCVPPGGSVQVAFDSSSAWADVEGFLCNDQQQPICWNAGAFGRGAAFGLQYDNHGPTPEKVYLWLRSPDLPDCLPYRLVVTGSGGCLDFVELDAFCDPGLPNPDGRSTRLMATQEWLLDWQVKWDAVQGPSGEWGYLLGGNWFQDPGVSLGLGQLCLLGAAPGRLARYNVVGSPFDSVGYFDSHGRFVNAGQTSDSAFGYLLPPMTPWGAPFLPGEAHYFQLWHRIPGGQSNLSNGVRVRF